MASNRTASEESPAEQLWSSIKDFDDDNGPILLQDLNDGVCLADRLACYVLKKKFDKKGKLKKDRLDAKKILEDNWPAKSNNIKDLLSTERDAPHEHHFDASTIFKLCIALGLNDNESRTFAIKVLHTVPFDTRTADGFAYKKALSMSCKHDGSFVKGIELIIKDTKKNPHDGDRRRTPRGGTTNFLDEQKPTDFKELESFMKEYAYGFTGIHNTAREHYLKLWHMNNGDKHDSLFDSYKLVEDNNINENGLGAYFSINLWEPKSGKSPDHPHCFWSKRLYEAYQKWIDANKKSSHNYDYLDTSETNSPLVMDPKKLREMLKELKSPVGTTGNLTARRKVDYLSPVPRTNMLLAIFARFCYNELAKSKQSFEDAWNGKRGRSNVEGAGRPYRDDIRKSQWELIRNREQDQVVASLWNAADITKYYVEDERRNAFYAFCKRANNLLKSCDMAELQIEYPFDRLLLRSLKESGPYFAMDTVNDLLTDYYTETMANAR